MEEIIETPPEGESGPEDGEREAFRELDENTFQPEAGLERRGDIEEAEETEAAFVELVNLNAEAPQISSIPHDEGEDTEYRVKVEFPWIGDTEDEDEGTDWARVATFMTDGDGAWYLPEVEDEVVADTGEGLRADDTDHLNPSPETTFGTAESMGEESRTDDPGDQAPRTDDLQPADTSLRADNTDHLNPSPETTFGTAESKGEDDGGEGEGRD